jgi:hypothetical protein
MTEEGGEAEQVEELDGFISTTSHLRDTPLARGGVGELTNSQCAIRGVGPPATSPFAAWLKPPAIKCDTLGVDPHATGPFAVQLNSQPIMRRRCAILGGGPPPTSPFAANLKSHQAIKTRKCANKGVAPPATSPFAARFDLLSSSLFSLTPSPAKSPPNMRVNGDSGCTLPAGTMSTEDK